ncbi:MAG: hypothetical protein M5R40_27275 [Anaerolineae bacterium]|nr:hypothetical protein [Anaerolineae bacterium]
MRRFLANLRWGVRWRMLILAVFVAYCAPAACIAALAVRVQFEAQQPEAAPATANATANPVATARTPDPTPARTPARATAPANDSGWDYRQSVDLRAELCARLRVPRYSEAFDTLCDIATPLTENTPAPIVAYLRAAFTPGKTTRAEVDAVLGAYRDAEGAYLLPVRVESGRVVAARLVFAFDEAGAYQGFDYAGEV